MAAPALTRVLHPSHIEAFGAAGFHLAHQLFAPAEVRAIHDAFMAANANGPVKGLSEMRNAADPDGYAASDPLAFYPRMMHPHRHPELAIGPLALRFMLDGRIESHLTDLFGDEPIAAQSMFYFKPPGARGQDFHQDNFYLRVKPGTCIAAWLAVDDADEENGAMMVAPGTSGLDIACPSSADPTQSFTGDRVEIPPGHAPVACRMRAGDVLFFNGSIIHGSLPNTSTTRFRRSLICHYVPKACTEVAQWYRPLLTFRGEEVSRDIASGGGPCGTPAGPH